jgi:hypothetical protein
MLICAMRIFDRFNQLPVSLAILCDPNSTWRLKDHLLTSPVFSLESNPNPFAVVVMAHLQAQEMKNKT